LEPLILEIRTRGLYRYHALDKSGLSIGRALDNDIILSDPTVEPYHLKIMLDDEGNVELKNLATINPVILDSWRDQKTTSTSLPIEFRLGRISAQILSRNHQVAATKSLANHGPIQYLFDHWGWAALLITLCFLAGGLEFFLSSYNILKWDELIKYVFRESVLSIAAFLLALSILERLLVNRWEIKSLIISVTLIYLIYQLLSLLAAELTYLLSSDLPKSIFSLGWYLLFIPAAISLYLNRVTHFAQTKSILLAALISGPFAIATIIQNPTINSLLDDFSPTANYQKSLSPLNLHFSKTVSIAKFIESASDLEPGKFSK